MLRKFKIFPVVRVPATLTLRATIASVVAALPVFATGAHADDATSAADYFLWSRPDLAASPSTAGRSSSTSPLPVAVDRTDNSVSVRTGISVWRDYNDKKLEKRYKKAKSRSGKDLKAPVVGARKPPLDVWTKVNIESGSDAASRTTRTALGADYKLPNDTTAGISAEQAETQAAYGAAPVPTDRTVSAYVNFKATPLLSIDARTQWQRADGETAAGIASDEHNSFTLAPKIEKKYTLGDDVDMTPYATIQHKFDIDSVANTDTITNSAGAGITFAKPDTYSVTVSTNVEHSTGAETPNLNSKLQLKLPLP